MRAVNTTPTMTQVPADHPLMKAWEAYEQTAEFANTKRWATNNEHAHGSLWAAFVQGWTMATERAAALHESVDPASDAERLNNVPGAGAMGAVIEYRDLIRKE